MYFEVKNDLGTAHYITVDTDDGAGVYTAAKWKRQITTGADLYWEWIVRDINARYIRLADVLGQGSPSGDKLTASLLLAYDGN